MNVRLGTAPAAWGVNFPDDPKQTPWSRYLDEVAEAGYEWTELGPYGYLPTDLSTLRQELDQRNLKLTGAFVMRPLENSSAWSEIQQDLRAAGELVSALNAEHLVLIDGQYTDEITGERIAPSTIDDEAWKTLIDTTHAVARLAREKFGLRTVFHPHAETYVQYEPQIERFLEETDPALVGVCFDIGHHAFCGGEPLAFLRKHLERIEYLHFKSVDPHKWKEVRERGTPFAIATAEDVFCEPSQGTVDFLALRDLLREFNYDGFGIVEHDMYPAPFDKPLPIARRTRAYLKEIGLG